MSTKENIDYKSYAVLTFIIRDIFGYLFGGIIFLVSLEILFGFVSSLLSEIDIQLDKFIAVIFVVALSYPIGRLLFLIGNTFSKIKYTNFDNLYKSELKKIKETLGIDKQEIKIDEYTIDDKNARLLIGTFGVKLLFIKNPSLYFLNVARPNILRIVSETTLGTVLTIGFFYCFFLLAEFNSLTLYDILILSTWFTLSLLCFYSIRVNRTKFIRLEINSLFITSEIVRINPSDKS